jgi:hypothetical protein
MASAAEDEASAAGLRRCADDLEGAFDGLATRSQSAWSCPAATAFEADLRYHVKVLESVAADLRATAARLEAAAAAQRATAEQAITGVDPAVPAPGGRSGRPLPVPVGGPS